MKLGNKIWDGAQYYYYELLVDEIVSSCPTIEVANHIDLYSTLEKAIRDSQKHHQQHVEYLDLAEGSVDVYKVLSWITWYMSKSCRTSPYFDATINAGLTALNYYIQKEKDVKRELPMRTVNLLTVMLKNEIDGFTDHGIAKNGLFLAFHTASEALKNCK